MSMLLKRKASIEVNLSERRTSIYTVVRKESFLLFARDPTLLSVHNLKLLKATSLPHAVVWQAKTWRSEISGFSLASDGKLTQQQKENKDPNSLFPPPKTPMDAIFGKDDNNNI